MRAPSTLRRDAAPRPASRLRRSPMQGTRGSRRWPRCRTSARWTRARSARWSREMRRLRCRAMPSGRQVRARGEDRGSGRADIRRSREVPHVGGADADDVEHMRVAVALARARRRGRRRRRSRRGAPNSRWPRGRGPTVAAAPARPRGPCMGIRSANASANQMKQIAASPDEGGLPKRRALVGRVVLDHR